MSRMLATVAICAAMLFLESGCAHNMPKEAFLRYVSAVQKRDAAAVLVLDDLYSDYACGLKTDRDSKIRLLQYQLSLSASTYPFEGSSDSAPYEPRVYFPPNAGVEVVDMAKTSPTGTELLAAVQYPKGSGPYYVREVKASGFGYRPVAVLAEHEHPVIDLLRKGAGPTYNLSSKVDEVDSLVLRAVVKLDSASGQWVVERLSLQPDTAYSHSVDLATAAATGMGGRNKQ